MNPRNTTSTDPLLWEFYAGVELCSVFRAFAVLCINSFLNEGRDRRSKYLLIQSTVPFRKRFDSRVCAVFSR